MKPYAHSLPDQPEAAWEPLGEHLRGVGALAAAFASAFGWAKAAQAAGQLHDIGKMSAAFQRYIGAGGGETGPGRVDHSTAGAREAAALYDGWIGKLLAFGVAGHHAGLADAADLVRRLDPGQTPIEAYGGWQAHAGELPALAELVPTRPFERSPHAGFHSAFLARMLFSCLVDADFLQTEQFYARAEERAAERGGHQPLSELLTRLRTCLSEISAAADQTPVNRLRAEVLAHATGKAALAPGLFTLTVPTGGGKTLTSLSFALEHAVRHSLARVVYVIPFAGARIETALARFAPTTTGVAPSRGRGSKLGRDGLGDPRRPSPPRGGADRNIAARGARPRRSVAPARGRPASPTLTRGGRMFR